MTDAADASVQAWIFYSALRDNRFAAYLATLGSDAVAWARCQTFFEATATHARGLRPDMHVGVGHVKAVLKALSAAI